jgi:hypothetical protein
MFRGTLITCAAVALLVLAACGGDSDGEEAPTDTAVPQPTIEVVESPTAANCDVAGVPGAAAVGQRQTIQGTVVGTSLAEDGRGRSIVLELGSAGGSAAYAVAIPESAVENFTEPPQDMYEGKQICVQGRVIDHGGVPTIFVTTPAEISEREGESIDQ